MSEIDEYKKSAAIASIKFNARLINGVIALSIFSVFMTITKFLYPLLSYMPINSIVIMLAITAVLIFLGFYLSNLSARTAIQRLNDYSNQVSKMVNTMEHEINQRKVMEKDLLAMSLTDDLTGLNNRRGFLTLAPQYLKMVNRQKTRTFLFYADADSFKHINDTFGHKEGDRVLIDIANMLIKTFRDSDIIARIGGAEIVTIPLWFL